MKIVSVWNWDWQDPLLVVTLSLDTAQVLLGMYIIKELTFSQLCCFWTSNQAHQFSQSWGPLQVFKLRLHAHWRGTLCTCPNLSQETGLMKKNPNRWWSEWPGSQFSSPHLVSPWHILINNRVWLTERLVVSGGFVSQHALRQKESTIQSLQSTWIQFKKESLCNLPEGSQRKKVQFCVWNSQYKLSQEGMRAEHKGSMVRSSVEVVFFFCNSVWEIYLNAVQERKYSYVWAIYLNTIQERKYNSVSESTWTQSKKESTIQSLQSTWIQFKKESLCNIPEGSQRKKVQFCVWNSHTSWVRKAWERNTSGGVFLLKYFLLFPM